MKNALAERPKLLVEFVRLKLGVRVKRYIQRKAERIFRKYPQLEGIRISVKREAESRGNAQFVAHARLVLPGYDRIIEKRRSALFEAISDALAVADRQLRKRGRLHKARQRHEPA